MKQRWEQLFLVLMLSIACFCVFCFTGCGDNGCETPKCGSESEENLGAIYGVSIPGCGGCLTSGWGCNSCLWPQSCKLICANISDGEGEDKSSTVYAAMDTRYYGSGCFGCGETEQACYNGFVAADSQNWGVVYGTAYSSGKADDEHVIGCVDGCGGCVASGGEVGQMIATVENALEIS